MHGAAAYLRCPLPVYSHAVGKCLFNACDLGFQPPLHFIWHSFDVGVERAFFILSLSLSLSLTLCLYVSRLVFLSHAHSHTHTHTHTLSLYFASLSFFLSSIL